MPRKRRKETAQNKEARRLLFEVLKVATTFAFGNAVASDAAERHKSDACLAPHASKALWGPACLRFSPQIKICGGPDWYDGRR